MAPRARRETAYHEAGHAVAAYHFRLAGSTIGITMDAAHLADYNAGKHEVNEAAGLHSSRRTLSAIVGRSVDREQVHHKVMLLLSGPAAGWIFAGERRSLRKPGPKQVAELQRHADGGDDHSRVLNLLDALDPFDHRRLLDRASFESAMDVQTAQLLAEFEAHWREALAFVVAHWPAVQAVADALWRKRALEGDEVREIIERVEARTLELPPHLAEQLKTALGERDDASG